MPFRRTTKTYSYPSTYKKKYSTTYPKRKYPLRTVNYQSKFEMKQPTSRTRGTAEQAALYSTPLWPVSKLIHNQLYYTYGNTLAGVSGITATHTFSANGIYDVDITGTGHQFIGFDQLMSAYEHYAVIRSKLTIGFVNNSSYAVRAGVYLSPDGVAITDPSELIENGLVKHVILDAKGGASTDPGVSGRVKTITIDCDVKKYFGKQKYSQLLEANYSGSVAANPTEQVYFNVFTFSSHTGTTNSQVLFDATLSYDVIYYEPRKLGSS